MSLFVSGIGIEKVAMIHYVYRIVERISPLLTGYRYMKRLVLKNRALLYRSYYAWKSKKYALAAAEAGRKIKVAFMMWTPALWKNDALFRAMLDHPLYEPILWISAIGENNGDLKQQRLFQCEEYAKNNNYPYYISDSFDEFRLSHKPDYVFVVQPYDPQIPFTLYQLKGVIPCYVPYAYCTLLDDFLYRGIKLQGFYKCYVESEYIREMLSSYMLNKGANLVASGLPIATQLRTPIRQSVWPAFSKNKVKLIWAPHWTISTMETHFLALSSFLELADDILKLVRQRDDISVAFKPHPWLKERLYNAPTWGKVRTDAYFQAWAAGSNTFVAEGDYVALFQQSDAIIHDSSSFIHEYLLVDKPSMFLERADIKANFTESTLRALECYQRGRTILEVEAFIAKVKKGEDPMEEKRRAFVSSYLYPDGISPVDYIIDDLLNP